jgi:hypothetical protein
MQCALSKHAAGLAYRHHALGLARASSAGAARGSQAQVAHYRIANDGRWLGVVRLRICRRKLLLLLLLGSRIAVRVHVA